MKEDKLTQLAQSTMRRRSYWADQLAQVKRLREPTGNWNSLQGKAQLPLKKVQEYFKARKKREKK